MNLAAALRNQISQSPKHEITLSAEALPKVKPQRANLFAGSRISTDELRQAASEDLQRNAD
jgi:hypothetical protein